MRLKTGRVLSKVMLMCGRYTQTAGLKTLKERFGFAAAPDALKPRYNIAPTQEAPVILERGGRRLELLRWGLIPSWAKDAAIGSKMINARAETILEKPSFKRPFQRSRCLVAADGFYEWSKGPGPKTKTPWRIALESGEPFAMAGLWEAWREPGGRELRSFAVITTAANEAMKPIHERMPVLLRREDEELWLDPGADIGRLQGLLKPWPGGLSLRQVSTRVNSPANDSPECAAPAASSPRAEIPPEELRGREAD